MADWRAEKAVELKEVLAEQMNDADRRDDGIAQDVFRIELREWAKSFQRLCSLIDAITNRIPQEKELLQLACGAVVPQDFQLPGHARFSLNKAHRLLGTELKGIGLLHTGESRQ